MGSSSEREQVTALGQFAHMFYAPETANGSLVPCTFSLQSGCSYFGTHFVWAANERALLKVVDLPKEHLVRRVAYNAPSC